MYVVECPLEVGVKWMDDPLSWARLNHMYLASGSLLQGGSIQTSLLSIQIDKYEL